MVDEAQKALEEAEALKKVPVLCLFMNFWCFSLPLFPFSIYEFLVSAMFLTIFFIQLPARQDPVQDSSKYTAADVRIVCQFSPSLLGGIIVYELLSLLQTKNK